MNFLKMNHYSKDNNKIYFKTLNKNFLMIFLNKIFLINHLKLKKKV